MCILFLAINQHIDYPLIICANRDEFYNRPTRDAQFWSDKPHLLAGKDLHAGGSWLGVNTQGAFAAITNIRTNIQNTSFKKSRGELVTMALQPDSIINFDWLKEHSDEYSPFNLTYGSLEQLNCYNSLQKTQARITDGFHAISNGSLDDIWPKMAKGELQLEKLVSLNHTIEREKLFSILKDQTQADDTELPDTGIPREWEKKLSSIFINSTDYGTRSSCLLLQNINGEIEFVERTYDENGAPNTESEFNLGRL